VGIDDFEKSEAELVALPGFKLIKEMKALELSFEVFSGNHRQVRELLQFFCQDERASDLLSMRNRHELVAFQKEITRLFHNYVASAIMVVDHAHTYSRLCERIRPFTEFQAEFDKRFTNNPFAQFAKRLRNYFLHVRTQRVCSLVGFASKPSVETRTIGLTKKELLEFKDWRSKGAKQFIRTQGEIIDLFEVVTAYFDLVQDFYGWLRSRVREVYRLEIEEFNSKQKDLAAAMIPNYLRACLLVQNQDGLDPDNCFLEILSPAELEEIGRYRETSKSFARALRKTHRFC
jgi:hypothetical protein